MNRFLAVSMFTLLAVSDVAHGTSIAFEFLGSVNFIPPELAAQFPLNGIFTGVFGFNSELHDRNSRSDIGVYEPLGFGHLTVESGRLGVPDYFALITGGRISVVNDLGHDNYNVQAGRLGACGIGITGPSVNGWELCGFELGLLDVDARVFESDALPLSPPDLEEFAGAGDFGFLRLLFTRNGEVLQVGVFGWPDYSSPVFSTVSEPGTLALLGLGLLGLGLTRRRAN